MRDPLSNIYSPENIARSRVRAASIQRMIDEAEIPADEWQSVVYAMLADAAERETHEPEVASTLRK